MSKYVLTWNRNRLERYLKEGRGQGTRKDYVPWISIHDFPSKGTSTRVLGWKTKRIHHFVSSNETRYFYLLEWSDIVTDIREQFPLIDTDLAICSAKQAGIRYPIDNQSREPYVMTTDFIITILVNGKEINVARTIKPSADLNKKRVIEKFEIERRYWKSKNIDWGIVTENEINNVMAKNIEWVHSAYELEDINNLDKHDLIKLARKLKYKLYGNKSSIVPILSGFDSEMGMENGSSLYIFKHLLAIKEVVLDMRSKIDLIAMSGIDLYCKDVEEQVAAR